MNNARQILDERLAKGEITIEQHTELAKQLAPTEIPPTSLPRQKIAKKPFSKATYWWTSGIGGILGTISVFVWYKTIVARSNGWVPEPNIQQAFVMLSLGFLAGAIVLFISTFLINKVRSKNV